jgi:hypothetical protein
MSQHFVQVVLICAYVPLGITLATYAAALILSASGRPQLLRWLVRRTEIREPETPPGSPSAADQKAGSGH